MVRAMAAKRKTVRLTKTARPASTPEQSPAPAKQAILVLGMHRSGTSALTRVLNLMGADLPKNIMGPGVGNDAGHWESSDLVVIHDDMLAAAGTSWHDWRAVNPDWITSATAESAKQRLLAVIRNDYTGSSLFAVKDPRICRFVMIWFDALRQFGAVPVRFCRSATRLKSLHRCAPPRRLRTDEILHALAAPCSRR